MARITVEDCLENVDNRFNLVLIAAKRARQLAEGAQTELEVENDKNTVLALREIAEGLVTSEILIDKDTLDITGGLIWRVLELADGSQVLQVATPEPSTLLIWGLFGVALFGTVLWRRRKQQQVAR